MIRQTSELSPGQRAVIEEILGRELSEKEAVIVRTCEVQTASRDQQVEANRNYSHS